MCENITYIEDDHPWPVRVGGSDFLTFPLCVSCHDEVDRTPLGKWPVDAVNWMLGLWKKLDRNERLMIMKLVRISIDASAVLGGGDSDSWADVKG